MPAAKVRRAQSRTGDTNFSNVVQTLDRAWSTAPFPGASSKVCGDLDAAVHWRSLATGCEELHWWSRTRHRVSSDGGHYNPWMGRDNPPSRRAAKTPFSASPRHPDRFSGGPEAAANVSAASSPGGAMSGYTAGSRKLRPDQRRVAPHCKVVNLVRSGRKQPQRFTASAGGTARLLCSLSSRST